jgi:hypothetical protein
MGNQREAARASARLNRRQAELKAEAHREACNKLAGLVEEWRIQFISTADVEQPTKFDLVVNLITAKALGLTCLTLCSPAPTRSLNEAAAINALSDSAFEP